jgi:type IV pilus assembly protein PilY1
MFTKLCHFHNSGGLGLVLALALSTAPAVRAAPGTLAQTPLFVSASVKPNILFVLDDSNSMQNQVIKSVGAQAAHPTYSNDFNSPDALLLPETDEETLALCLGYNALAYDPTVTYTPWSGSDRAGTPYTDRTLLAACVDPYDPASCNVNLTEWVYFRWDDDPNDGNAVGDGDGDYDAGECPRPYAGGPGAQITPAVCAGIVGCVAATNAMAPPGVNGATNYANWYSYYRMRDRVQKGSVSEVIDASEQRVGLVSLQNFGSPATPVRDLGDVTSVSACGAGKTNKACLLDRLFNLQPLGTTTPLRSALDQAGRYFDENGNLGHAFLPGEPSPILLEADGGSCQQNFAILVTDGAWSPEAAWDPPSPPTYGDADSDNKSPWDGGSHADGDNSQPTCPFLGIPNILFGTVADTLADIAMYYYEQDLSPLDDEVPTRPGVDDNTQQHLVTFTVGFGVDGTLTNDPSNRTDPFPWPPVCIGGREAIDDLRHAAWNGRGRYLSAKAADTLALKLVETLALITQYKEATIAALAFSTGSVTLDTLVFQAQLDTTDWTGNLLALDVDPANGAVDTANPVWQAVDWVDNAAPADRVILTRGTTDGVPLTSANWNNLAAVQKNDLRTNSAGVQESDAAGLARLEYLRGDHGCEGAAGCIADVNGDGNTSDPGDVLKLRPRTSRLGDIVNGGPIVVGAPALSWPSAGTSFFPTAAGSTYAEFKSANAGRTPVVYVGANDGMLHGFKATANGGEELIAYVPTALSSSAAGEGLHRLSETTYNHRFYVDRTPAVSDVYIEPTGGGTTSWRTVAVGGLGAGGRGLYALDITDPTAFNAANAASIVMWEFTRADDAELGYTFSQPVIAMMNNGKWAAIVGSGYNDTGSNEAHLFIVFLQGGIDGTWTAGTDYIKIEATLGTQGTPLAERNGLSSPAVADLDRNGTADRIYVGDLLGNLWAFDVSDQAANDWITANANPTPLFTATDALGKPQPITARPEISKHPSVSDVVGGSDDNQPNVMVYFGTGQYLGDTDKTTLDPQSFYGVWDRDDFGLTPAGLRQQEFLAGYNELVVTDHPVDWTGQTGTAQSGWYLNLPEPGERVVSSAILRGGTVFFNSIVPSDNPCQGGGYGLLTVVDMENGGQPEVPQFDSDGNGVVDVQDLVSGSGGPKVASRSGYGPGIGIPSPPTIMGSSLYTAGTSGGLEQTEIAARAGPGRLSWQQLFRK